MASSRTTSAIFFGFAMLIASCSSASTGSRDAAHGARSADGTQNHVAGSGGSMSFDNADPANGRTPDASIGMHAPAPADHDAMSGCGSSEFKIAELPPNVMILLDRSASMDGDAGDDTRWNVAKKAIETLTAKFDDRIRFGLATYSSCVNGGCSAGRSSCRSPSTTARRSSTSSPPPSTSAAATARLNNNGKIKYLCDTGDPETPTGKSLAALVGEKSLLDTTRDNAVVLLTDGAENDECAEGLRWPVRREEAARAERRR